MRLPGRVYLVGAGPGDPDLLTVKAVRLMERADVVVHDRLVSPELLAMVPSSVHRVDVGKAPRSHPVPQERINDILVDFARKGFTVVRLKGGDPSIFGRGSEEAAALIAAGVPVEFVPGITAAQGAAAAAGLPLTHRGLARGVRYVTGHCKRDLPLDLDWDGLADPETTLVVYMGAANIAEIAARLIEKGMPPALPVLAVASATTPRERHLVSRLDRIAAEAADAFEPVLFVVGHVVSLYRSCPAAVLQRLAERPDGACPCLGLAAMLAAAMLPTGGVAAEEVSKARATELERLVVQDCGSCHGLTMRGGLGPDIRPQTLDGSDRETLAVIILDGVPARRCRPGGRCLPRTRPSGLPSFC